MTESVGSDQLRLEARERLISRRALFRAGVIAVPVLMVARVVPAYAGGKGSSGKGKGKGRLAGDNEGLSASALQGEPAWTTPFDSNRRALTDGGFNNTDF